MKTYRCLKCGKLRYGNADEKGSEGIVCWVCTFNKLQKSLNFSQEVEKLSNSLQELFMKIRSELSGKRGYSLEEAEELSWKVILKYAIKNKKGKYRKKRGAKVWKVNIKEELEELEGNDERQ